MTTHESRPVDSGVGRYFQARPIDDVPQLLENSYSLRYQVYCVERKFLPARDYPAGLEIDEFDRHSIHVGAVDTLIGDITPPSELMKTLTDRKLAEQEQITYGTQEQAEMIRKNLAQATAMADTQPGVVTAERSVQIASFTADAAVKTAQGQAKAKEVNATADAMVLKTVGAAEGEKILAVGTSEAEVIKKKTAAMDPEKYAMVEVARALAASGFKLVPDIVATGGAGGTAGGNSLVNILLASVIRDNVNKPNDKKS